MARDSLNVWIIGDSISFDIVPALIQGYSAIRISSAAIPRQDNCNYNASYNTLSRSQAVSQTTVTEAPFFDDGTSTTIERELKADTKDHKKKKFNGWQIFGISIGAIFGFFFLCKILDYLGQ